MSLTGQEGSPQSVSSYLHTGGFPEYVKQGLDDILNYVLDDILVRDIAVRYEDTYLLYYVPKFDHSYRKQLVNPRKVYAVDTGLVRANSVSFSEDLGRLLENMVFLHIRRHFKEIFYFSGKGECDFVVLQKGTVCAAIQVCYDLNPDNLERELNGINEAMQFFGLKEGVLVTYSQHDSFDTAGGKVTVIPMAEFLQRNFCF